MQAAYDNFNYSGAVGDCGAAYGESDRWKCVFGQYRAPFLKTPYLIAAARFDSWQVSHDCLGYDGIAPSPRLDADETTYVEALGNETHDLLATLPGGVFSVACYSHHVSEGAKFYSETTLANNSLADALARLLGGDAGFLWADACGGFGCGACGA